ncbi:LacI family DNA-binding transcriptional regulator [Klebsiella michiganensis]|nr:LacI family DNA-binding transcriptional regulator [Klebsiella michiganensis]
MAIAKKITINDVAQAAGVSVSTVSLVLSGKGRISSTTGERVNHAIEQLGFVRNRQAASLRGGTERRYWPDRQRLIEAFLRGDDRRIDRRA